MFRKTRPCGLGKPAAGPFAFPHSDTIIWRLPMTTEETPGGPTRTKVFSGIQPSGVVHIGNYVGAIRNWAAMMDDHDCTFCVVDLHAMTAPYDPDDMRKRVFDTFVLNMAAGLDPERSVLFVQSHVPEVAELCWVLMSSTSIGDLNRMTQFKDKSERLEGPVNAGLFTYPVLMAADILLYRASIVPVGDDQTQHLELAREICRRFNATFGETFPEPQALLSTVPRLMGLDGKDKMSKSLNNHISLLDTPEGIWEKLRTAATDPARVKRTDPGTPEICNIFTMHKAFSPEADVEWSAQGCRTAGIGCIECKKKLCGNMAAELTPIRERYEAMASRPDDVRDLMASGAAAARAVAAETMDEVRRRTGLR
jgi:tryptophanyl-tRNA synthetase